MNSSRTDEALLEALRKAAGREMSAGEVRAQRISYVLSALSDGTDVSRAEVEKMIDRREGHAA